MADAYKQECVCRGIWVRPFGKSGLCHAAICDYNSSNLNTFIAAIGWGDWAGMQGASMNHLWALCSSSWISFETTRAISSVYVQSVSKGKQLKFNGQEMLNLASNDYLGLASKLTLREQFFDETPNAQRWMSSASSRLLTGNFPEYEQLEASIKSSFSWSSCFAV